MAGAAQGDRSRPADHLRPAGCPDNDGSAKSSSLLVEFLDECSEMRRDGSREGVVLLLKAFPNCFSAVSQNYCSGQCGSVFDAYLPKDMIKVIFSPFLLKH